MVLNHLQYHKLRVPSVEDPHSRPPTQSILATVLRVSDLREAGNNRGFGEGLYERTYLDWVEPVKRAVLEELASEVVKRGISMGGGEEDGEGGIEQVVDQYLGFITPGPELFSLLPPPPAPVPAGSTATIPTERTSYGILNSPSSSEQEIEDEIERIATGCSVLLSQWRQRSRNGGQETRDQDSRRAIICLSLRFIRTWLKRGRESIYPGFHRLIELATPLLAILDRNIDLASMLSHGWTYQALVSDCFSMKLNRVTIDPSAPASSSSDPPLASTGVKKRSYDLDSNDFFWARNAANPFPQVAEEIDVELNKYKQDAAEITRKTGVSDVNDISQL
ncbi:Vesicle trafficking between the ER and Golgi [Salix suchowensis]|nr:Vesicle trafficking between the ER and Golgi [Salix suchowensis]